MTNMFIKVHLIYFADKLVYMYMSIITDFCVIILFSQLNIDDVISMSKGTMFALFQSVHSPFFFVLTLYPRARGPPFGI
ncbi:MAG: hypothetical protein R3Y24_07965 [Eubacteriales bacterium]